MQLSIFDDKGGKLQTGVLTQSQTKILRRDKVHPQTLQGRLHPNQRSSRHLVIGFEHVERFTDRT
jgi:hypothetical protein